jgi:pyruvate-formate lyase-activating enzyme
MLLNLHALWPRSRANGPGVRMVLWLQGCTLGCPGCFNPATHAPESRWQVPVAEMLRGSANKAVHLLTDRYRLEDLAEVPPAEVIIDAAGNVVLSGIDPPVRIAPPRH